MKGRWAVSIIIAFVIAVFSFVAALFLPVPFGQDSTTSLIQFAHAQTSIDPRNYRPGGGDFQFADPAFQRLWSRLDLVYMGHKVERTWFWGPGPDSVALFEPYLNLATRSVQRRVQYFDKSRMEINDPNADSNDTFRYVSTGLLSVELISGDMQVGTNSYIKGNNACISMAGDTPADTLAPTYFAFGDVSNTRAGDHDALDRTGQKPIQTIDHNGNVGNDLTKILISSTDFVHYENKHNIPRVFWDFLHMSGPVYLDNGQPAIQQLIDPWFYLSGLPISEPYWARATIRGKPTEIMIQAFERVILTYTPSNAAGWQVEMGNIGQHYFNWRYSTFGLCPGAKPVAPQPLVVAAPLPLQPQPVSPTPTMTPFTLQPPIIAPTLTQTPTRTNTPTVPHTLTPTTVIQPPTSTPTFTEVPTFTAVRETPRPTRTFTPQPTNTPVEVPSDTPTATKTKTATPHPPQ